MGSYVEDIKVIKDLGFAFHRNNANPMDRSSIWGSLSDARSYARGEITSRGAAYTGQVLAVYENGKVDIYKVVESGDSRDLELIGGALNQDVTVSGVSISETITAGDIADVVEQLLTLIVEIEENGGGGGKPIRPIDEDIEIVDSGTTYYIGVNGISNEETVIQ